MNALLERERAIVSNVPGTTRDTIEEHMDICGIEVVITDTAGLRRTSNDAIEAQGFERARKAMGGADVALWVVDGSQPLNSDDNSVGALIRETSLLARTIILVNKNDLPQQINTTPLPAANKIINISCTKASGLDSIGRSIVECVTDAPAGPEIIMVNERHCSALKNADLALSEAENAIAQGATEDLLAFHVREALDYLGEITGATADEEILSKIFSNFCIGK